MPVELRFTDLSAMLPHIIRYDLPISEDSKQIMALLDLQKSDFRLHTTLLDEAQTSLFGSHSVFTWART